MQKNSMGKAGNGLDRVVRIQVVFYVEMNGIQSNLSAD